MWAFYHVYVLKIFPPSLWFTFLFLSTVPFEELKSFQCYEVQFIISFLMVCVFLCPKKLLPSPKIQRFSSGSLPGVDIGLWFILCLFLYMVKYTYLLYGYPFVEKCINSLLNCLGIYVESNWLYISSLSEVLSYFIVLYVCPYTYITLSWLL